MSFTWPPYWTENKGWARRETAAATSQDSGRSALPSPSCEPRGLSPEDTSSGTPRVPWPAGLFHGTSGLQLLLGRSEVFGASCCPQGSLKALKTCGGLRAVLQPACPLLPESVHASPPQYIFSQVCHLGNCPGHLAHSECCLSLASFLRVEGQYPQVGTHVHSSFLEGRGDHVVFSCPRQAHCRRHGAPPGTECSSHCGAVQRGV